MTHHCLACDQPCDCLGGETGEHQCTGCGCVPQGTGPDLFRDVFAQAKPETQDFMRAIASYMFDKKGNLNP